MYGAIAIYKSLKNIAVCDRPAKLSDIVGLLGPGSKIYIDKYSSTWAQICFVRYDYQAGGDLKYNGKWIKVNDDIRIIWAKGREMDKRQQHV